MLCPKSVMQSILSAAARKHIEPYSLRGTAITPRTAPLPIDEARRVATLRAYRILDTDADEAFDELTRLAAQICNVPIALVSLVDAHRQWFKSRIGLDATETPREQAFCAYTLVDREPLIVADATADERFVDNPLVTGHPHIRFYAGFPLIGEHDQVLGTLCVIDSEPRHALTSAQLSMMAVLARQVMALMELRRTVAELAELREREREFEDRLIDQRALASLQLGTELRYGIGQDLERMSRVLSTMIEPPPLAPAALSERIDHLSALLATATHSCEALTGKQTDALLLKQGWQAAIAAVVGNLSAAGAARCQIECQADPETRLDYASLYHLFQIARTALIAALSSDTAGPVRLRAGLLGADVCLTVDILTPTNHDLQRDRAFERARAAMSYHASCMGAGLEMLPNAVGGLTVRCVVSVATRRSTQR